MHRVTSNYLYGGEKKIFATHIQENTRQTLGFWLTRGYSSMFGHIIIRVMPGGESYYVFIAETVEGKIVVTQKYGPFISE
jgi:hypothetical protein